MRNHAAAISISSLQMPYLFRNSSNDGLKRTQLSITCNFSIIVSSRKFLRFGHSCIKSAHRLPVIKLGPPLPMSALRMLMYTGRSPDIQASSTHMCTSTRRADLSQYSSERRSIWTKTTSMTNNILQNVTDQTRVRMKICPVVDTSLFLATVSHHAPYGAR